MQHPFAIAATAIALIAGAAAEQPNPPPTEGAAGMAGQFVFNQADGKAHGCALILDDQGSHGQYDTKLADDCTQQFQFLDMLSGWVPTGDGFTLLGTEDSPMIEMHPDASGIYRGRNSFDDRDYYMERTSG